MSSRGRPLPPGMMRHGPPPGVGSSGGLHALDPLLPPELAEKKMVAEIDQLAGENHRLAAAQVALRQELVASQEEIQRVKAHIKSIQTESDIQIRLVLEKTAKMESEARAGLGIKNELQEAHMEAQNLVTVRQELTAQIEQATQELEKARADIKIVPDMLNELDSMREEHQKLRAMFEYEKRLNIDQVEQMRAMERDLVGMAREVERLRVEVLNAEKRVQAPPPYGGPYVGTDPSYASGVQGNGPYYDPYLRPHAQMAGSVDGMVPYGSTNALPAASGGSTGSAPVAGGVGTNAIQGNGPYYDPYSRPQAQMAGNLDGMVPYGSTNAPPAASGGITGSVPVAGGGHSSVWGGYDSTSVVRR
ncbi:hypothetical protein Ancab_027702 [Ancistrocladus abbreviatus]